MLAEVGLGTFDSYPDHCWERGRRRRHLDRLDGIGVQCKRGGYGSRGGRRDSRQASAVRKRGGRRRRRTTCLHLKADCASHPGLYHMQVPQQGFRNAAVLPLAPAAIPRLAQWKKSPKQAVESRLTELQSLITLIGGDATAEEGQSIIISVSQLVLALSKGADSDTKAMRFLLPCKLLCLYVGSTGVDAEPR